ncbi:hypothetical protein ACPTGR_13615, partial [Enterococcus faecium]
MTGGLKMIEFDKQISRKDTESVKWDAIAETYQMDDLLPLWVADMDFLSPGGVAKAFSEYIKHGIFGYATLSDKLYQAQTVDKVHFMDDVYSLFFYNRFMKTN